MIISKMAQFASGLPPTNLNYMAAASNVVQLTDKSDGPKGALGPAIIGHTMGLIAEGELTPHHVSREFGKHLQTVNLDVKAKYLKSAMDKAYYFEFPEFKGFKGVCAVVGTVAKGDEHKGDMFMAFTYFGDNFIKEISWIRTPLFFEETIEQAMKRTLSVQTQEIDKEQALAEVGIAKYFVNLILYVESGNPDLERIKKKECLSKSLKKQRNFAKKFFPFDICRVGYNTHHGSTNTQGHTVSGHFRWQPWGKMWSKLKLIWIDEYSKGID